MAFTSSLSSTKTMKLSLKNWLLINKKICLSLLSQKILTCLLVFFFWISSNGQIANYVNNGGFEIANPANMQKPKYWDAIDTTKYVGVLCSQTITPYLVPNSSFTHQWPVEGANYFLSTLLFKPNTPQTERGYPRNKLKQTLQAGKNYCVRFYVNVTDATTYGADGLGAYFGDSTLDTISKCMTPISYLTPQIQYGGFVTDTMNWIPITGTFTANGTEKYMMLGNYKSDAMTNTVLINPTNLPLVFCDVLYDNVSVIDIDLPAFAGRDTFFIPGDSVYLGRPSDVGIDEVCTWYKLPNTTTAVDTVAGFWLKPTTTCTYVVKQDICGNIKYDTIILYQSAIGVHELTVINESLKLYPQPTSDILNIELNAKMKNPFSRIKLMDNMGRMIREEEIVFINNRATIDLKYLPNGIYLITLSNNDGSINKKLVITN
jgi:hypothetical protein